MIASLGLVFVVFISLGVQKPTLEEQALDYVINEKLRDQNFDLKKLRFSGTTNGKSSDFQFFINCFYPNRKHLQEEIRSIVDKEEKNPDKIIVGFKNGAIKIRRRAKYKIEVWNALRVRDQILVRVDFWDTAHSFQAYFVLFSISGEMVDVCYDGAT